MPCAPRCPTIAKELQPCPKVCPAANPGKDHNSPSPEGPAPKKKEVLLQKSCLELGPTDAQSVFMQRLSEQIGAFSVFAQHQNPQKTRAKPRFGCHRKIELALRPATRDPLDRRSPCSSEASGRRSIGWVAGRSAEGYPEAGVRRKLFSFKDLDCETYRESPTNGGKTKK